MNIGFHSLRINLNNPISDADMRQGSCQLIGHDRGVSFEIFVGYQDEVIEQDDDIRISRGDFFNYRNSKSVKIRSTLIATLFLILAVPAANAEIRALETANALNWTLENYAGGPVVIWNSGAICTGSDQALYIKNATPGDINRLYSTVLPSKVAGAKIFIRYNEATCAIDSFGFR